MKLYNLSSCSWIQEVERIRNEHPDDACSVMNDRVKGSLKVTRAFGAGFLKQVCFFLHSKLNMNSFLLQLERFRSSLFENSPLLGQCY